MRKTETSETESEKGCEFIAEETLQSSKTRHDVACQFIAG